MVTHSSVLAWRIPGTGEPGGLPSMGSHRVGHDWSDSSSSSSSNPSLVWGIVVNRDTQGLRRLFHSLLSGQRKERAGSFSSSRYANSLCGIPEGKWILAKKPVVDPPPLPSVTNERYSLVMNIFISLSNRVTPATQHWLQHSLPMTSFFKSFILLWHLKVANKIPAYIFYENISNTSMCMFNILKKFSIKYFSIKCKQSFGAEIIFNLEIDS